MPDWSVDEFLEAWLDRGAPAAESEQEEGELAARQLSSVCRELGASYFEGLQWVHANLEEIRSKLQPLEEVEAVLVRGRLAEAAGRVLACAKPSTLSLRDALGALVEGGTVDEEQQRMLGRLFRQMAAGQ